jgi:hypothetical protein
VPASGQPVHLVQHQQLRNGRGIDFRQDFEHVAGLRGGVRRGDIHHVQDQGGVGDLFERGAEGLAPAWWAGSR